VEWRSENSFEDDDDPDYVYAEDEDNTDYDNIEWDETLGEDDASIDMVNMTEQDTIIIGNGTIGKDYFMMENEVDNIIVKEFKDNHSS
jgi:hypothetical protein